MTATEQQSPRVQALRADFLAKVRRIDPKHLVFLDEAGSHIAMTRDWARSEKGKRIADYVPRNRGVVTTMIGALGLTGLRTMMTIEGATNAAVFDAFVTSFLIPSLKPGDVVVLDNVGAHQPRYISERIEDAGASVLFLPPYSPDLNPIEECWSKVKALLRRAKARSREALDVAIATAMDLVTPSDVAGWFGHSGYQRRRRSASAAD